MKRMILSLFIGLLAWPVAAGAFSFFSIKSAQTWKIDAHTYRLQVEVRYGGDMLAPAVTDGAEWVSEPSVYFTKFELNAPVSARNFFFDDGGTIYTDPGQTTGSWASVGSNHTPGSLGRVFGFDFDDSFGGGEMPLIGYSAKLDWCQSVLGYSNGGANPEWGQWIGEEYHFGTLTPRGIASPVVAPEAIPEPATLALFGLGLAGAGVWRLRKS